MTSGDKYCDAPQALQAPACHENMVKVGGYILGEFGNLIAGDPRSRSVNICKLELHLQACARGSLNSV